MRNNLGRKVLHTDKTNYTPIATIKQEDNISIELELYKDGVEFDITGQKVTLAAKRADKVIIEQIDGFTINNNILGIELKNNINAKIGLVYLELTLKDSVGSMTTLDFYLKVNGKILGEDSLDASDNIASLEKIQQDFIESSNALLEDVIQNENTRIDAEAIREGNEATRARNETLRESAETLRENAETKRVEAEKLRASAEEERVAAERIRDEKIEEISSQCTKNTKNIVDNTKDIERAFDTINDSSFLPFEGENTTVEHSKVGFTKDMVIEGITYQNLAKKNFVGDEINTSSVDGLIAGNVEFLKANTTYTISYYIKASNTINVTSKNSMFRLDLNTNIGSRVPYGFVGEITTYYKRVVEKFTTEDYIVSKCDIHLRNAYSGFGLSSNILYIKDVIILEGEPKYIPEYFEGIKSVAEKEGRLFFSSNGKNLFDKYNLKENTTNDVFSFSFYKPVYRSKITISNFTDKRIYTDIRDINSNRFIRNIFINANDYTIATLKENEILTLVGGKKTDGWEINNESINILKDNFQIVEGDKQKIYEVYKEDKKEILLPFEGGLKKINNSIKDYISMEESGIYIKQNIDKIILNNESNLRISGVATGSDVNTIRFVLDITKKNAKNCNGNTMLSNYNLTSKNTYENDEENIQISNNVLFIRVLKTRLETQDVSGFKKWLQANQITVYYELETPIDYKIVDLNSINLETFKDVTYVFSENSMSPSFYFKAPVDVLATISTLRARNENLEQENKELKEEVDIKTLKLHGQDVELTNSDLDLDFRVFELEMSVGLPINLNMKGMRNMARSPFEMMKILVLNNNYDREDIEYKASRYLQGKRMTQEEYNEIISLMDANELVK